MEELEFKFTKEMADLVFESINIKEKIKSGKMNNQEKERLEIMFLELRSKFINTFSKSNDDFKLEYDNFK